MNDDKYYEALDICLQAIQKGADPDACMQLFPDLASELRPLLQTALMAQYANTENISSEAYQRSRMKFLAEADAIRTKKTTTFFHWRIPKIALAAVVVVFFLIFGVGSLLATSVQALPGDEVYPLKIAIEGLRMRLTGDYTDRTVIIANNNQRRINEVQNLLDMGREVSVVFTGEIEEITSEFFIIDDILVKVSNLTEIIGNIDVGTVVQVRGKTIPDGWIQADEIILRANEILGIVERIDSSGITINGNNIFFRPLSQIDQRIKEGDQVLVLVEAADDGTLIGRAVVKVPFGFSAP